jgi:hypothetical protein
MTYAFRTHPLSCFFEANLKTILLDIHHGCSVYVVRYLMAALPYIKSKYAVEVCRDRENGICIIDL